MAKIRKTTQRVIKREAQAQKVKPAKRLPVKELLIIVTLITTSVVAVLSYSHLYKQFRIAMVDQQSVYGVWVEQNVAGYVTNKIHIGPDGISISGGVITTSYEFDGKVLEYKTGDTLYRFRMTNEESNQMIQISDNHYNPRYHLIDEYKHRLR